MSRSRLTLLLALLSLLLTGSLMVPGVPSAVVFPLVAVAFPVALIALGAVPSGRAGAPSPRRGPDLRLAGVLVALVAILELSAAAVLALSGTPADGTATVAGLPPATLAAIVQLAGLWLLPLPLVALGYAWTFDRSGVTPDDLASLRGRYGAGEGFDRRES